MSPSEWRVIVTDMIQRGATGTETEMQSVIAYLGKYLAKN